MSVNNQEIAEKLKKIGLSGKEAEIYTTLLLFGGAFPSTLAEKTKINRTTIYKVLENLAVRGLVSEVAKSKKIFYQAENPKNVARFAQSQVTLAKRRSENALEILPLLEGFYANAANKPIVRFFEGKEGVLQVYEDHVAVMKPYEMLAFSNTADLMEFLTDDFRINYIKKKEKIGITTRAILPDAEIDVKYNETIYSKFPKKIWPKIKNVPRKAFPYKSDLTIYGENKVSIINFSEPQFAATIIEDKTIHDMMQMIFELAWVGVGSLKKA